VRPLIHRQVPRQIEEVRVAGADEKMWNAHAAPILARRRRTRTARIA
jgi:hypothetical protein